MKSILFIRTFLVVLLLVVLNSIPSALAETKATASQKSFEPIVGKWLFDSYRYQGAERPRPNPDLEIYFTFFSDHTNDLYWHRIGENGFCQRRAVYSTASESDHFILKQQVTWINPENRFDCAKDPDMQMGQGSVTRYKIVNGKLETEIQLGDEVLYYIWVKIN